MAESPSSAQTLDSNANQPEPDKSDPPPQSAQPDQPPPQQQPQQSQVTVNPHSNPPLVSPLPSFPSYTPPPPMSAAVPPSAPSYRAVSLPTAPQFTPAPNYMMPPGVSSGQPMMNGGAPGAPPQMMQYQVPPGQPPNPAMRHYAPMPNGYAAMPTHAPQGTMPYPGLPRYTSPYMTMVRPAFAPRPMGTIGMLPGVSRPLVPGVPGVRPVTPTIIRPAVLPIVTPGEKPQTTVYVGKIAPSVENDFMLNLLQICGLVKGWKRAEDPTTGTPKGFGFCEFASAEGVLRALRLLNKFNIDGQALMLNVNQGTKEYLERYVEKKTEIAKKLKGEEDKSADNNDPAKVSTDELKKDDNNSENKETQHNADFGIVTDEDREADREASEKIANKIEERLKTRPLPPPPPLPPLAADGPGNSNSDLPVGSRDAETDVDVMRNDAGESKTDDDTTGEKPSDQNRPETSSPDRSRRNNRRSRERDLKRDKEREVDRYEKEADRERIRKEREQRRKIEDAEREYAERIKEWEYRESKREKMRQYEKEREKDWERKRKREILDEEEGVEKEYSRKRGRKTEREERRKMTLREREDDLADKEREEEEIAEAKKRAEEELKKQEEQQKDALKLLSSRVANGSEKTLFTEDKSVLQDYKVAASDDHENHTGDGVSQNGTVDDSIMTSVSAADTNQGGNAPAKKLGFGLVGSGKKHAVPSVFHEEDDDDAQKDKKMRPLVPIDYSTEELQAVQPTVSGAQPPNLAAAAEFAKRISNSNSKEEKHDQERERSRRSHDRSSHRDRERNDEDAHRTKDDKKEKVLDRDHGHGVEKAKTPDNKKLLDAKQLIDMIPKTKEELFSYEINWAVYDKHELHERMRPWISKKIMEFLGEEEPTLVNYIVSSTQEHVRASQMLEQLQSILDEEAEMFVLKMWRMLIFEVKKVETGLSVRSRT